MGKKNKDCWKPEKHPQHMCKLYKKGLMMEYDEQALSPSVKCAKCGATARLAGAVCQPTPLQG
jgi:hypothetical protein